MKTTTTAPPKRHRLRGLAARASIVIAAVLLISNEPGIVPRSVPEASVAHRADYHFTVREPFEGDLGPLADFVEAQTGWEFTDPLPLVSKSSPPPPPDDDDDKDWYGFVVIPAREPPVLRALGLVTALPSVEGIPGDVKPDDPPRDARNGGVYWSPVFKEEIVLTPYPPFDGPADLDRALVHELTHALQTDREPGLLDYHDGSDIPRFTVPLPISEDRWWLEDTLFEGQAGVVEGAWYWAQRPGAEISFDLEYRDYDQPTSNEEWGPLGVEAHVAGTWFLSLFSWLPIGLTPAQVVEAPPASSDAILNPEAYLLGDIPETPPEPEVDDSYHFVDEDGDLSARRAWSMLAPVIDVEEARRAIEGWGGSTSWVVKRPDDVQCVAATVVGDTPADTQALKDAFADWIDATDHPRAEIEDRGDYFQLNACDPGGDGLEVVRRFDNLHALNRELFHVVHVLRWLTDEPPVPERWACLIETASELVPTDVLAGWEPLPRDEAEPLARQAASTCDAQA